MKNFIKSKRQELNITQEQLAMEIGQLKQALQRYEYGRQVPSVEIALRIARALNTTVEELFVLED